MQLVGQGVQAQIWKWGTRYSIAIWYHSNSAEPVPIACTGMKSRAPVTQEKAVTGEALLKGWEHLNLKALGSRKLLPRSNPGWGGEKVF